MDPDSSATTSPRPAPATRRTRLPLVIAVVATLLLAVCTFATMRIVGERGARTIDRQLQVQSLTATVQHLDEILTMSANMTAATGARRWRARYDAHVGKLDEAIAALRAVSPELFDRELGQDTADANQRLIAMETEAFELVEQGQTAAAMAILDGETHAADKDRYAQGNQRVQQALADLVASDQRDTRLFSAILILATLAFTVLASASWIVHVRHTREEQTEAALAVAHAMSQSAEEANRAKTQFVANISHELRTPLTAILGYADLLAEPGYPEAQRDDACRTILRNGEHLLQVINDLLDMSKIEAGIVTVEKVATDPVLIVEDVVSLLRVRAREKGLALETVYATRMPRSIDTDPVRLRQILVNLVGNAIKFTAAGQVSVRVSFDLATPVPTFAIAVADPGIGMNGQLIERLFQPFVQADGSMTRRFGGTGLGLAISRRYAEVLGGRITVRSEPGVGSVFTLSLALARAAGAALWQPDGGGVAALQKSRIAVEEPPAATVPLSAVRILLAEDGRDNQRLVTHILKKAGAEVVVVENGRQAVDLLGAGGEAFALVLMDMQMPELDGYAATRLLRERGVRVPIVALTANAMSTDRERCMRAGCDDYLSKPIDRAKLLATCARWATSSLTAAATP